MREIDADRNAEVITNKLQLLSRGRLKRDCNCVCFVVECWVWIAFT